MFLGYHLQSIQGVHTLSPQSPIQQVRCMLSLYNPYRMFGEVLDELQCGGSYTIVLYHLQYRHYHVQCGPGSRYMSVSHQRLSLGVHR